MLLLKWHYLKKKSTKMARLICYTLDLEPDFGGRLKSYSSLNDISYFQDIIKKNRVKLTTFVAGHMLIKKTEVITKLLDIGSEIELHSYSHNLTHQNEGLEIKKSKKAYTKYFRKKPLGYRAPKGMITKKGLKILKDENFKYDSSIYPTIVPGRYNNLRYPNEPFYHKDFGIIELPLSVIPKIRIPLAMGYLQPLGINISKNIINLFRLPNIIVFDFHLWNLYKPVGTNKLPLKWKLLLARNLDKGFKIFNEVFKIFEEKGYKSITMKELYYLMNEKLNNNNLTVF